MRLATANRRDWQRAVELRIKMQNVPEADKAAVRAEADKAYEGIRQFNDRLAPAERDELARAIRREPGAEAKVWQDFFGIDTNRRAAHVELDLACDADGVPEAERAEGRAKLDRVFDAMAKGQIARSIASVAAGRLPS